MGSPSTFSQPSATPSTSLERSTRLTSTPYSTSRAVGRTMPENFSFAERQRPAAAGLAEPAQEEAQHLPQRIEAEAAGHHRIALEMASEEPEVRLDVEFGAHLPLAVLAALVADRGDAVEHEHGRERQLGIARTEKLAAAAGEQLLVIKARRAVVGGFRHG